MKRKVYRGLSLIEVALGLAIGAILLTAVATAVKASADSMRTNEDYFFATQTARVSLTNIVSSVRTAWDAQVGAGAAVDHPTDPLPILYVTPTNPELGGTSIAYVYDANGPDQPLLLDLNPGAVTNTPDIANIRSRIGTSVFVVARHITDMSFTGEHAARLSPNPDPDDPLAQVSRMVACQIDMTVKVKNQSLHLVESVTPRCAFKQK